MREVSQRYESVWDKKPVLRTVYGEMFDRISRVCVPGVTLEIGGGIGNLKSRLAEVISSDIQLGRGLDLVADAQLLPFRGGALSNIVMLDVLHHIQYPALFFHEAERALRPGGRIVMIEPAITWGSSLFYRLLHQEPVDMSVDPLVAAAPDATRDPFDANQALPTLLATRYWDRFHSMFPSLSMRAPQWFAFLVYPLSGGFKSWSLVPNRAAKTILGVERRFEPLLGRFAAFRMQIIVDKQ
jgi:SAM-dependent methyltransferase